MVGIFPNGVSCIRMVTTYLVEYAEDGLSPEPASVRHPLRQHYAIQLNFIFQEPFL